MEFDDIHYFIDFPLSTINISSLLKVGKENVSNVDDPEASLCVEYAK